MSKYIYWLSLFLIFVGNISASPILAGEIDVDVTASIGQKYDDNITYAESDEKADLITSLSAGVNLTHENKRTLAELKAIVTQHLFLKYNANNNLSENLNLNVRHELTKSDRLELTNDFSHTYDAESFAEEFARPGGLYSYFRNQFDVGYERDFSQKLSVRFGYGNDLDLPSRSDLIDSYVNRASLEGYYAFSPKTVLLARYGFVNRELDPGGVAKTNSVSGGVRRYLTNQLSLEVNSGIDIIDSYNGERYSQSSWMVSLDDQVTERTLVNIFSFNSGYTTDPYTSDVFDYWQVSSAIQNQLTKKLSGALNGFYGQGEYISSDVKDNFIGGQASLTYDINKSFSGRLSYSYSQTTSNVETREYRKNVISWGMNLEF